MKKSVLIIAFLFVSFESNSQVLISLLLGDKLNTDKLEFGLEFGSNFSYITQFESQTLLPNLNLGFYFDIKLKNQLYLNTGLDVKSNMGVSKLTDNDIALLNARTYSNPGDYKLKTNNFLVPALIRYRFKNHFYVEAGPQFILTYNSYIEYTSDHDGLEARIRQINKDDINKFDVGAMGGLGYIFKKGKGLTLGVKYYFGFIDVMKTIPGKKNSSILLKLNVPIGREKAAKKATKKAEEKKNENP